MLACERRELILQSETYYTGLVSDSQLHVKLTGSWETVVGEVDQFGAPFETRAALARC